MAEVSVFFGETGARKTTAMGHAAEYLYERSGGKIGRAIYADGGGWRVIKGQVEAGLVQVFNVMDEPNFPMIMTKLSQGWWPSNLDPVTGLRPRDAKTGKPIEQWIAPSPEVWSKVGFYIWEGLTSSAELNMKYLRDTQQSMGGDPVGKFTIADPTSANSPMLFCSNNMKHYDWAATNIIERLTNFSGLPVERVLVTAHEASGTDEGTQESIRGPALVGKKATAKVARNLGDCIHFEVYSKKVGEVTDTDVRCYFQNHPDPKFPSIFYHCKTRVPDTQIGELKKAFPGGYFLPDKIGDFLRTSDELILKGAQDAARRKAEIDARLGK